MKKYNKAIMTSEKAKNHFKMITDFCNDMKSKQEKMKNEEMERQNKQNEIMMSMYNNKK